MSATPIEKVLDGLGILICDENPYTRKLTRMMLTNIGAKTLFEAPDGLAALDVIRSANPDVVIMDWELPVLNGSQIMKIIRSPGVFPKPNVPVITLTGSGQRSRVHEALRLGVNEFLLKPTSPKALRDRLISILIKPRPMIHIGKFYVPTPRRPIAQSDLRRAA